MVSRVLRALPVAVAALVGCAFHGDEHSPGDDHRQVVTPSRVSAATPDASFMKSAPMNGRATVTVLIPLVVFKAGEPVTVVVGSEHHFGRAHQVQLTGIVTRFVVPESFNVGDKFTASISGPSSGLQNGPITSAAAEGIIDTEEFTIAIPIGEWRATPRR